MILLHKSATNGADNGAPGHWWLWKTPTSDVVMVCCPKCKRLIHLSEEHEISADGTVTPSCVCPTGYCDFHAQVKLAGWLVVPAKPEGA